MKRQHPELHGVNITTVLLRTKQIFQKEHKLVVYHFKIKKEKERDHPLPLPQNKRNKNANIFIWHLQI